MKTERFEWTGHQGMRLPAVIWMPEGEILRVIQVTHGMTEHMGRYEAFAQEMTVQGIAVAGFDLRGHGQNPGRGNAAVFAEGAWEASLADMNAFSAYLQNRFPDVPRCLFGHSLGSFLVREYLGRYPQDMDAAIIMGTGNQPEYLLKLMRAVVRRELRKIGYEQSSPLIQQLAFGSYNQRFKPSRTKMDWLCSDDKELDLYLEDPLCREEISAGLFYQMLEAMSRTARRDACGAWNREMPVLLLGGAEDPVGNMGKGMQAVRNQLEAAGVEQLEFHLLPGARHLLLNEKSSGAAGEACRIIRDFVLNKIQRNTKCNRKLTK